MNIRFKQWRNPSTNSPARTSHTRNTSLFVKRREFLFAKAFFIAFACGWHSLLFDFRLSLVLSSQQMNLCAAAEWLSGFRSPAEAAAANGYERAAECIVNCCSGLRIARGLCTFYNRECSRLNVAHTMHLDLFRNLFPSDDKITIIPIKISNYELNLWMAAEKGKRERNIDGC